MTCENGLCANCEPSDRTVSQKFKTAVVIVTFNRLGLLKKSLESVLNQTLPPDNITIVDNCSTDGTALWLRQIAKYHPKMEIISPEKNIGSSGGFSRGMQAAFNKGADWIWTMDDDTIPDPDAFEKLISAIAPLPKESLAHIGYLCSKVIWKDGSRHLHNVPVAQRFWWDGYDLIPGCIKLEAATFVSALFNRVAIEAVGFPIEEFFIWWDDVEYTSRMSVQGYPGYHVDDSQVLHLTAENKTSDYCSVNEQNLWKYCYGLRNHVAVLKARHGRLIALGMIMIKAAEMKREKIPYKLMVSLIFSGFKGYFMDYQKLLSRSKGPLK
jgi:GT2 family glycosyltransferase